MRILLIGLSHKTAPLELRECLTFTQLMLDSALTHFNSPQAQLETVSEGVILSTCNRLEVYALAQDAEMAITALINWLSRTCAIAPEIFSQNLYIYHDKEAIAHLLRVAAGLESMILGEAQILGQIAAAYQAALSQGAAGPVLSALFKAALQTGKRVRTETAINLNSASISSVAASLAGRLFGDLRQCRVLLVGAGEMGAIAVKALLKRGVSHIVVANRTYDHAARLAQLWGGQAIVLQQLPVALAEADIVITSTSAPHPLLNRALLEPVMTLRPDRPLFIIDIAVPRDVDPDVRGIPTVHLHDLDDLQRHADEGRRGREAEIPGAETIIEAEVEHFLKWLSSLAAVSTIADLRQQVEQVRQREVEELFNRLKLDEHERKLIVAMSQRLVNKILHEPTLSLKKEAANGNGPTYIATTRQLFSLDSQEQIFGQRY